MRWPPLDYLRSTSFLGILLFVFAAGFPPFDDQTSVDLSSHMLQHVLIILAGVMTVYPLYRQRMQSYQAGRILPWAGAAFAATLIIFWHMPGPWDTAVLNPFVHAAEHFSFFGVGLLGGSAMMLLSDSGKIGVLLAAFFGHMAYAVALIVPWTGRVYDLYSIANQTIMGWALLLTGPFLAVGVAYIVARNPDWLGGFGGSGHFGGGRRETFLNRVRVPRWVAPAMSSVIFFTFVGYLGFTVLAVSSSPSPLPGNPTVYVLETPVSWQFSPQEITVVLGVNDTVTWVSHSISYDSVTDRALRFDSGPIPPGGTYSHTFLTAGTYDYYCIYHPWMSATVTVLPRSP